MSSSRRQGPRILRRSEAFVLVEPTKRPHRLICKLATSSPDSDDHELQQMYSSLPRFGPFYNSHGSLMWTGKEEAWQHVLRRSPTQESETIDIYLSMMRRIEEEARGTYADGAVDHLTISQFRWMMIKDGSFILQLALFALGCSAQLAHPPNDLIFGEQRNSKNIKRWIKSMFFVGNQIPLVVLNELMNQDFFQQVVLSREYWEQPEDLLRRALYDLLVLSVLKKNYHRSFTTTIFEGLDQKVLGLLNLTTEGYLLQHRPSDLLHGLHLLVLGPGSRHENTKDGSDSESTDDEDFGGRESILCTTKVDLEAGDGEDFGDGITIRSATELRQAGVHFKNVKGMGSRGIKFTSYGLWAVLTLPALIVNDDTESLFRYLKKYEITQHLGINEREVSSYLQIMSELVRKPDDAKLLASQGVVRANRKQREKLPGILHKLASGDTNENLRLVRLQINDYSGPPWEKIGNFLSVVLLLTAVQTVYTVLGYYKKP